jgi:DNA-binding CsgD family transcriptional regulator
MSEPERVSDSQVLKCIATGTSVAYELEIARLSAARKLATEEAGAAIAQQLNGPLTALLLYMGEIKLHSHQLSQAEGNRIYLQQVVENALAQTERVCAMMKQMAGPQQGAASAAGRKDGLETRPGLAGGGTGIAGVMFSSEAGQKPLTRREREVLGLISEGRSNKQGALQMNISPRTFESHRAEAMRKLGVRNTAELVRSALLHPSVA